MIKRFLMQCTNEQFKAQIEQKLKELGFKEYMMSNYTHENTYLHINLNHNRYTDLNFYPDQMFKLNDMMDLGKFNPELLFAVLSINDKEYGIPGEYWKCINLDPSFTLNKLYKANCSLNQTKAFIDDTNDSNGFNKLFGNKNLEYFQKATLEEIVEHFKGKEVTPEIMAKKLKAIQELLQ
jgi:hypothetical protein